MQSEYVTNRNTHQKHPITAADEHCRNLYFDMLCSAAITDKENIEVLGRFIQKLITGCTGHNDYEEHLKYAYEITERKIKEFIFQCRQNDLCEMFLTDTMIMACLNGKPEKNIMKFIADMAETLEVERGKLQNIAKIVKGILKNDFDALCEVNDHKLLSDCNCYFSIIEAEYIAQKEKEYSRYITSVPSDKFINGYQESFENIDSIVIENQTIIDGRISFKGIKTVIIRNCIFKGVKSEKIEKDNCLLNFNKVDSILIENCAFSDINSFCVIKNNSYSNFENEAMKIINSSFSNCISSCKYGIIQDYNYTTRILVQKSIFKNCHYNNEREPNLCITDCQAVAINCTFEKCGSDDSILFETAYLSDCDFIQCCRETIGRKKSRNF